MSSVAVIDYGMGNLHSIAKALQFVSPESTILVSADPDTIRHADRVVFPGVGAIRDCMEHLKHLNLIEVIQNVSKKKPFLGICLGLQALLESSRESGEVECLGLFRGSVVRFENSLGADGSPLKIPHMGWNAVLQTRAHPLWSGIPQNSRFYFVHSYHAETTDRACIAATADYPGPFTCALARDNLFAVQFHPEKSQTMGLKLLRNFSVWDGRS
ncbi:MAG: imidazole glycerol phosphate synthase subunit HisH [Methylococcaceae bacterium]|nr:imidazole glycerol phosphate synthase subunit HisH [Methylococcaceae bacterium]MCI0734055.1 imidazole glycerol phosphate synthase subunit HisH [Methylococcaceae bacterium]